MCRIVKQDVNIRNIACSSSCIPWRTLILAAGSAKGLLSFSRKISGFSKNSSQSRYSSLGLGFSEKSYVP